MRRMIRLLTIALLGSTGLTQPAGAAAQGLPVTQPAKVKIAPAGLARLDSAMQAYVKEKKIPGIVLAVARNGQVAHLKAFGHRSLEHQDPMETGDLFRIYSMTKPITSAAVMMLVDDGKIGLDDPVAKYLPVFANIKVWSRGGPVPPRRPMTVRDLLRHTAGFTYGLFGETPVDSLYRGAGLMQPGLALNQLLEKLAALPLVGHPGEIWNYGFSTDVLGRLIEVVSGMPLDRFFATRIFEPLRMPDTFFQVPPAKRSRFVGYYASTPAGPMLLDSPDTGSYTRPPSMFSGGGGLVSTAADYLRFSQMMLNGGELDGVRVLRRESAEAMLANQLPKSLIPLRVGAMELPGTGFGFGFSVVVDPGADGINDHARAGWGGYANTHFFIDPHRQVIALVLTQTFPFMEHPLEADFRKLVYSALSGR